MVQQLEINTPLEVLIPRSNVALPSLITHALSVCLASSRSFWLLLVNKLFALVVLQLLCDRHLLAVVTGFRHGGAQSRPIVCVGAQSRRGCRVAVFARAAPATTTNASADTTQVRSRVVAG